MTIAICSMSEVTSRMKLFISLPEFLEPDKSPATARSEAARLPSSTIELSRYESLLTWVMMTEIRARVVKRAKRVC
jgi:hypothetical protein